MEEPEEKKEYLGVTDPLNVQYPTPEERLSSEKLTTAINVYSPLESEEGLRHREQVLRELSKMVLEWIYEVGIGTGGYDHQTATDASGKIFTFGSYRLGVVGPNSDIDALCAAPRHVSRESFFQMLAPKLQEHPKIVEVQPVPDAYTPIIKMIFDDVDIDLLFARMNLSSVKDLESLEDDNLLKNLDDKSVRCMNGCRVNDAILKLVPNQDTFKEALRFVKYWAKQRGLYSNVLGFFGGITWAILIARMCQLYPNACTSIVVGRFFRIYERWNWKNAVILCQIREHANTPGLSQLKVWNPRTSTADRNHLMPIVTPAFPSMNSTYNVTHTTKRIILAEMKRAEEIVQKIERGELKWQDLLTKLDFFSQHHHYIQVSIIAKSDELFRRWSGWIESKLRFLVKSLEPMCDVRPWPNALDYDDDDYWPYAKAMFVGLKLPKKKDGEAMDLRQPVVQFVEMIKSWSFMEEFEGQCDMRIAHMKRDNLPSWASQTPKAKKEERPREEEKPQYPTSLKRLQVAPPIAASGPTKKKIKVSLKK
eukprot:GEMP01041608.1.p1 GENE.GEMP01041608.1~~GEMP01041608.1.p1  ORF type:complete len:550 (+),score=115.96 GEMP01041608.1:45-1652(+)